MHSLTPIERTAFVLRHMENLTTGEIGSALGVLRTRQSKPYFARYRSCGAGWRIYGRIHEAFKQRTIDRALLRRRRC